MKDAAAYHTSQGLRATPFPIARKCFQEVATAMPVLGSRRSNLEIVYDILSLCDNSGVGKTAIMYGANLSHTMLRKYLSSLASHYLIQIDSAGKFRTTPQGRQLLTTLALTFKFHPHSNSPP